MTLPGIVRFECAYQRGRLVYGLLAAALFTLAFLMTRDGTLAEALHDEFFVNSSFAVAKTTVVGTLVWLLVAGSIAGEAAARDVATRMYPLVYTSGLRASEYLGGRFLAALALNALLLAVVQAGIVTAVYAPGVDAAAVGPFRPAAFLTAYAFLALPTAFAATALQFMLAALTGRPMASYLGSVLLFFMAYVLSTFLFFQGRQNLAYLLDPIGVHFVLSDFSHQWTTWEKSWRMLALEGTVLTNRVVWLTVGFAALGVTLGRFRFAHRAEASRDGRLWRIARRPGRVRRPSGRQDPDALPHAVDGGAALVSRPAARRPGLVRHTHQTLATAGMSFRAAVASWAGIGMLLVIPLLSVLVVIDQMESESVRLIPATTLVIRELTGPLTADLSRWVIVPILMTILAGELVWRARDAGLGEMTDAMPGSEWPLLLGRLLGLSVVLALFTALLMAAGMTAQWLLGHRDIDVALYVATLGGLQLPVYLLFAALALVVHVLVDQKYVGHLVSVLLYLVVALAGMFGLEHDLLIYGTAPPWSHTEMRGFGGTVGPWFWFTAYWAAWAALLLVGARLLWVRGRERAFARRLDTARQRLAGGTRWGAGVAAALVAALGGFVFYNTNVINAYLGTAAVAERRAEYERRYAAHAHLPQPAITKATLRVEIDPARGAATIHGTYRLVNDTAAAIGAIHVSTHPGVETGVLSFDRPSTPTLVDEETHYRIHALDRPLAPGETLHLDFDVRYAPRGFAETGAGRAIVPNGSAIPSAWLPAIGYLSSRELTGAADRRAHDLPERPVVAKLDDPDAPRQRWQAFVLDVMVGTDEGQVAVAPGALMRSWTEEASVPGARRRAWYHYATDAPVTDEFLVLSATYAVHEVEWRPAAGAGRPVAIRIYHHPGHAANIDRMARSIQASLDYYTREFGPYPYGHLTFAERAANGTGMHADASLVTFTEGAALWRPPDSPDRLDLPYAVVAHEMAHQWGVPSAAVEGAPVMSESLAWYYGMKVVEHSRGVDELQRLRRFWRQPSPYPPIRRGEPLLRGLDPHMAYRRGPFALYALSEYVGEAPVNLALRRLLARHREHDAPLATTRDLYRELRAVTPVDLQYLLRDLFEVNTFWELETTRVTAVEAGGGAWDVALDVRARKVVVDETGAEAEAAMHDWVEVGVYAVPPGDAAVSAPLHLEKRRLTSGTHTITVRVPSGAGGGAAPVAAGLDPRHLLIDLEPNDNVAAIAADAVTPSRYSQEGTRARRP